MLIATAIALKLRFSEDHAEMALVTYERDSLLA